MLMKRKDVIRNLDKPLFLSSLALAGAGFLAIYSATRGTGSEWSFASYAVRQLLWIGLGILSTILVLRIDYFKFQDWAWPIYFVSLFFLTAVLVTPARLGAHRWIPLGPFNFQPSELAKFSAVLALARFFASTRHEYCPHRKKIIPFLIVIIPFALIFKEPDLGSALVLIPVLLGMLYLWGVRLRIIVLFVALALLASPVLFSLLKDYQKTRLLVFVNPSLDPLGAAYTIIQSKIAIGSGCLWGKGFLAGSQTQLRFVPERHTDFIFSVFSEEWGFLGCALLLILFWIVIQRGFSIASQTHDRFGSSLAAGISTLLAFQIIVNLGMTMGLFPVVGMPLPFVSYGGSSIVVTFLCIGLLLNIRIHRPIF